VLRRRQLELFSRELGVYSRLSAIKLLSPSEDISWILSDRSVLLTKSDPGLGSSLRLLPLMLILLSVRIQLSLYDTLKQIIMWFDKTAQWTVIHSSVILNMMLQLF
jgi:hypothetical protein